MKSKENRNVVVLWWLSWWLSWWFLSQMVLIEAAVNHPALGVMLNVTAGLGSVEAVLVQPDDYKAHFLKRGML